MFSVIFPGQGSQSVGMGKEFYGKYDLVKSLFKEADEALNTSFSKIILEGPKEELEKNEAIDKKLLRYMTVKVKDFDLDTNYFAKREDGEKFEKKERASN